MFSCIQSCLFVSSRAQLRPVNSSRVQVFVFSGVQLCPFLSIPVQSCLFLSSRVQSCSVVFSRVQSCSVMSSRVQSCPVLFSCDQSCSVVLGGIHGTYSGAWFVTKYFDTSPRLSFCDGRRADRPLPPSPRQNRTMAAAAGVASANAPKTPIHSLGKFSREGEFKCSSPGHLAKL